MALKLPQLLALVMMLATPATASAKESSRTINYLVEGRSAADVYDFIKRKAPKVAANATFAFTTIATKTEKGEQAAKDSCRYKRFKTSAIYGFVIPKHKNSKALPARTRPKWDGFTAYLQNHEEGHRTIWRDCFAGYDKQAMDLVAKTCGSLDQEREELFTRIKLGCVQQDEAYDVQFRKDVMGTPFMREAQERKP